MDLWELLERFRIAFYIERVMDLWEVQSAEDVENENLSSAEKMQQFRGQPAVHDPTVSQRTLDWVSEILLGGLFGWNLLI